MTVEQDSLLRSRAARHAALGDVSRLAIVDALVVCDRSPGELGDMLGLRSNLLAHHLRVLDDAGLIVRRRSEGDARRSYLSLNAAAMAALTPPTRRRAQRVVFVCTHNSARSQLAAVLWRHASDVPATSAGTQPADRVHPGAVAAARRHHLSLRGARTAPVEAVLTDDDLVVTVCDTAHETLAAAVQGMHWSITDPVRVGTDAAFDQALEQIAARVAAAAETITREERR